MNTDLRKKVKNNFGTDFFTFMNNVDFRKTLEKLLENIEILKLSQEKEEEIMQYHNQVFHKNVLAIEMKKL